MAAISGNVLDGPRYLYLAIKYHLMLTIFYHHYLGKEVSLRLPILFEMQHPYGTRCLQHLAAISHCRKSFTKRSFHCQAVTC